MTEQLHDQPLLAVHELCKSFPTAETRVDVLQGVSFSLARGKSLAIVGRSGSGKSTLLQIIGGLMTPSSGKVHFLGDALFSMSGSDLAQFRNEKIGFVFQFHHLLPDFTAWENVCMPLWIQRKMNSETKKRAKELLERVGLGHRLEHRPAALSGGEQQRVAIARALVAKPKLVIADEPTGNLDFETSEMVSSLLLSLIEEEKMSLCLATHSKNLASHASRIMQLKAGVLSPMEATV